MDDDAARRLAEASRLATQELHKSGTPEYDVRAHQRAIEAERRARGPLPPDSDVHPGGDHHREW